MNNKIAALGNKEIVTVFKSVGAEVFSCNSSYKINATLKMLFDEEYTLILITENEYLQSLDFIKNLPNSAYPIILPIPNGVTYTGLAAKRIDDFKQKAIGAGT